MGSRRTRSARLRYVLAYKPYGIISAYRNRDGLPALSTLGVPVGLPPAGRLDRDSEGLLLLTNDGALTHRITHPRFSHSKTYFVLVLGQPDREVLRRLREGVEIKLGLTKEADVEVVRTAPNFPPFPKPLPSPEKTTWLRIVLYEGMNRQIRRMTGAVGHAALRLIRVAIGPLTLPSDAEPGKWRDLSAVERKVLLDWVWPHGRPTKRTRKRHRP